MMPWVGIPSSIFPIFIRPTFTITMTSYNINTPRWNKRVDCGQSKAAVCTPNASLPKAGPEPSYLQGLYMASPAVDVAWFMAQQQQPANGDDHDQDMYLAKHVLQQAQVSDYLTELKASLIKYDDYLWATRNDSACAGLVSGAINLTSCPRTPSNGPGNQRGLLWSIGSGAGFGKKGGAGDSGEDGTDKYVNNTGYVRQIITNTRTREHAAPRMMCGLERGGVIRQAVLSAVIPTT